MSFLWLFFPPSRHHFSNTLSTSNLKIVSPLGCRSKHPAVGCNNTVSNSHFLVTPLLLRKARVCTSSCPDDLSVSFPLLKTLRWFLNSPSKKTKLLARPAGCTSVLLSVIVGDVCLLWCGIIPSHQIMHCGCFDHHPVLNASHIGGAPYVFVEWVPRDWFESIKWQGCWSDRR